MPVALARAVAADVADAPLILANISDRFDGMAIFSNLSNPNRDEVDGLSLDEDEPIGGVMRDGE